MTVDAAIARLQALSQALTSVAIKGAPNTPPDTVMGFPFSVAYFSEGSASPQNGGTVQFLPKVNVDFHFTRANLKTAYEQINAIGREYPQRLCGDPTLKGTVTTIVFPVTWTVGAAEWDNTVTLCMSFSIGLKTLETPTTTA